MAEPVRETTDWRQRAMEAEKALREILAVMPVLPPAAKQIIGLETRYENAIRAAKKVLANAR